jgi:two-component system NarL family sensor kinase
MSSTGTAAVLRFAVSGLIAAAVITAGGYWVVSRNAISEATRNAQEIAAIDGRQIVEPILTDAVVAGDPTALTAVDGLVRQRVLSSRVVRVKVWTPAGKIVYSDARPLVGRVFPLGAQETSTLHNGAVVAEVSDLTRPENQLERPFGRLLEVYLPVNTNSGTQLLFETYQVYSSVTEDQQRIWSSFFPVLVGGILLLLVAQVPLAWQLARSLDMARRDREGLLQRAIDASEAERRRIARDLHDGVVQTLAGAAFSLSAAANKSANRDGDSSAALDEGAKTVRQAVSEMRSLIVEIAPPNLDGARLEGVLADLLAEAEGRGLTTSLRVTGVEHVDRPSAALLYRASQEAIRNAAAHAGAGRVEVELVASKGAVSLTVKDDGRGFTADEVLERQREGHVGLAMLRTLVEDGGGELSVHSEPGHGSTIRVSLQAA